MKKLLALFLFLLPLPALAQIGPVGAIQVGVTPVTSGTNGDCLTISNGKLGQTASCGGAAGLTVGTSTISSGTASGIVWNSAGVVATGAALTNTAGDLIAAAGQALAIGSASVNTGVKLVQNGGAFRCKISDGSADCAYQGLNFVAIGGTFGGASGSTLNLTVDGTAKLLNAAGTSGVVLNFGTDGAMALFARDGTTAGVYKSGTNTGLTASLVASVTCTIAVSGGIVTGKTGC